MGVSHEEMPGEDLLSLCPGCRPDFPSGVPYGNSLPCRTPTCIWWSLAHHRLASSGRAERDATQPGCSCLGSLGRAGVRGGCGWLWFFACVLGSSSCPLGITEVQWFGRPGERWVSVATYVGDGKQQGLRNPRDEERGE